MKAADRVEMLLAGFSPEDRVWRRPVRWAAGIVTDRHQAPRRAPGSATGRTALSAEEATA